MPEHEPETWVENINRAAQFCSVYTMGPALKEWGNKEWNHDFTKVEIVYTQILRYEITDACGGNTETIILGFNI